MNESHQVYDPFAAREAALEEGAGRSPVEAHQQVTGEALGAIAGRQAIVPRRHVAPRRRGSSRAYDADSALMDETLQPGFRLPSVEERQYYTEAAERGHAQGTAILRQARREAILRDPHLTPGQQAQKLQELALADRVRRERHGR